MSCGNSKYTNFIPITGGPTTQKDVVLIPGPGIQIEDLSDVNAYRFVLSTQEIVDLSVNLTVIALEAGDPKTSPILRGTVIDELNLTWVYNKAIVSQTLTNTGSLTPPSLTTTEFSYNYTGQNVQNNLSLTIQGNDGLAQPGSIASDTKSISFGNIMWIGAGTSKINESTAGIEAFIESLSGVIKTSRNHTYFATGGVNQKHFVAYPAAFGLGTFTKGIFTGGYIRLKNVGGTLKSVLGIGDIESPITITNSKGYSENYYIYESEYDNQADNVTPFTIS
jgi:hypothetical protein